MNTKKFTGLLLSAGLVAMNITAVLADESVNQTVTFDGTNLTSSFDSQTIADAISNMEPGDQVDFEVTLVNNYTEKTDWWMRNEILQTFEDTRDEARAGGYSYYLTYTGSRGELVLFSSDEIGGSDADNPENEKEGLNQVEGAIKDFFYLDALDAGQSGRVHLTIVLDGETQRNNYQDTLANLELQFGVEVNHVDPLIIEHHYKLPLTSDNTNLTPYLIALGICGLVILGIAIYRFRKEKGDEA